MEHWNFHGYIALPLEEYGKTYIGSSCKTADEIECGEFVDAMLIILLVKFGTLNDLQDFVGLCSEYEDAPAAIIPKENAQEIFNEFKRIMET